MDIEVRGRTTGNASRLRSKVTIGPGSVVIRIDDERNLPAWIEVELTTEQLADMAQESSMLKLAEDWGVDPEEVEAEQL